MNEPKWSRERVKECEDVIDSLEDKYLGEQTRHIPYDKFFRMLAHGMTEAEAKMYTRAKMTLIEIYHEL